MRNILAKSCVFLLLWLIILGFAGTGMAAPEVASPSAITMKTPATFMVNEREVASADLLKALKKNKIPTDTPLVIEVPANTSMDIIKNLTQRLATAGYKPFFKYPRHADATVTDPKAPAPPTVIPPKKQRWRK